MKRHLFQALVFGLLTTLISPQPAQASSALHASCIVSTPAQRLAWSSVVFQGRVAAVEPEPSAPNAVYAGPQRITFTADRGWKGAVAPTMVVTNRRGSGDLRFARGEEYLVYATGDGPEALQTDSCLGTRPLAAATEDVRFLGSGMPAEEPRMPGLPNTGRGGTMLRTPLPIGPLFIAAILALLSVTLDYARVRRRARRSPALAAPSPNAPVER